MSDFLSKLLTYCLYLFGIRKEDAQPLPYAAVAPEKPLAGTNGKLDAEFLILHENGKVVMVLDHNFTDIPEWVEWDLSLNIFGIVQMGGAVATLKNVIPQEKWQAMKEVRNVLLSTQFEGRKIVHSIYMVIRE